MNRIPILDHGYIELLDSMGDDLSIVNGARQSFDEESHYHFPACPDTGADVPKAKSCICSSIQMEINAGGRFLLDDVFDGQEIDTLAKRDVGLINFLMRERHTSPFELVQVKLGVMLPIFVAREWMRHRTQSFNEMSSRYTHMPRLFYVPAREDIRVQKGKPGAYYYETMESDNDAKVTMATIHRASHTAFDDYEIMLANGVAKEVARLVLPVNTYSKMVWKTNLRALMNFLSLRNHDRAQREIRVYAEAMEEMAMSVAPVAMDAFISNGRTAP